MANTLRQLIQSTYGVKTRTAETETAVAVAITATRILQANPNRLGLMIVNVGAANISISTRKDVTLTTGVYIQSGGGNISYKWNEDFEHMANEFWAIGDGGVSSVHIVEILAY